MSPAITSGTSASPVAERRHQDRREPFARAAQGQARPKDLAFIPLQMLIVIDQHDLVARRDPEDREEADQRTERDDVAGEVAASSPPTSAEGRVRKPSIARRVFSKEASRMRNTPITGGDGEEQQAGLRPPVAPHTRPGRPRDSPAGTGSCRGDPRLRRPRRPDRGRVDLGAHVDAARVVFPVDHALRRPDAHVGDVAQPHVPAIGRVDQQIADTGQSCAAWRACSTRSRRTPCRPGRGRRLLRRPAACRTPGAHRRV